MSVTNQNNIEKHIRNNMTGGYHRTEKYGG